MKFRNSVFLSCASLVILFALNSSAAFDTNRIVVLVSLDGLANFYFNDPKADMPNLRALAKEGARAKSMEAVIPTVTWPNHTTLVTGDMPARHGVLGNNYFDRGTRAIVTLIRDPVFDKDEIVKVPTIYDLAKEAGLKTAAVHWPATRNAKTLDWQIPSTRSMDHQKRFSTPSLLRECEENGIKVIDSSIKERSPSGDTDTLSTDIFNFVLKKHRPQLALLHVGNTDHAQHSHGPRSPQAYAAIKGLDGELGKVWRELQTDYPGRATLFVVSDHGFSAIDHMIPINPLFNKLGLETSGKAKQVEALSQGGSLMVYILDQSRRDEIEKKIVKAYKKEKGVTRVLTAAQYPVNGLATPAEDSRCPDIFVLGDKGYAFGDTSSGQIPASEKSERHGTHGQDPLVPDLQAFFVAWGVDIKPGSKVGAIKNIDVAPTMAKVLQIELPNPDGHALNAILSK
jgi:predicted AlkP superfamily pyrophosphatase or phosphodiesterase